jgi:hypothetical protein
MKQSERVYKNEDLARTAEIAKKDGCKIYTFKSSSKYIEQIFIESRGGQIGSCSAYLGGIQFSTVHKSKHNSGNGSGFGNLIKGQDFDRPEQYKVCFISYPYWINKGGVYKFTSFNDYLDKGLGILTYYEL